MKNTIFIISISLLSISFVAAQSFRVGPPAYKNVTKVTQIELPQSNTTDSFDEEQISKELLNKPVIINTIARGSEKLQVIRSSQGAVSKRMLGGNSQNVNTETKAARIQRATTAKAPTYTESFENYNGTDLNWIPTNWSELNKTGNVFVNDGTANPTWAVRGAGEATPTNGKYMAWVNYAENKDQDEWLISNSFTLNPQEELLFFDVNYSPYFMYFDFNAFLQTGQLSFDFSKPTATLQAYVSSDNGQNWEIIWDAHENVALYNSNNINDYKIAKWYKFQKPLSQYSGKTIKIAFRYVGRDGDSMGLDNIEVRALSPDAFYKRPNGYFYLGYTPDFKRSAVDFTYGAAFEKATWINKSGKEAVAFNWTFPDPIIENKNFTTSVKNPEVTYPDGFFKMPLLKASVGFIDSTYIWGTSQNGSYSFLGGTPSFSWGTTGVGNYDRTKGIVAYKFAVDDFVFGTDSTNRLYSVANYFEKPIKKYILENVWINFGTFVAPPETEFKIIIHKFKTNQLGQMVFGDTIASSYALAQDAINPVNGFYSLNFQGFSKFDPELGLDVTKDYLEIEDAILIEFTGFSNNPDIKLSVFSQPLNTSGGETNAYVIYNNNNVPTLLSAIQYIRNSTSLLMNLGATYSYLHVDNNEVHIAANNSKTIIVKSNYTPDSWWLNEILPSWLKAEYNYDTKKMTNSVTFTAEPLPEGLESRQTVVKLATLGSELDLTIIQDKVTGVDDMSISDTHVISQNNNFELNYSNQYQSVAIMTASGQQIGRYNLPASGNLVIPASHLSSGIYIVKFMGNSSKSIKVVR